MRGGGGGGGGGGYGGGGGGGAGAGGGFFEMMVPGHKVSNFGGNFKNVILESDTKICRVGEYTFKRYLRIQILY